MSQANALPDNVDELKYLLLQERTRRQEESALLGKERSLTAQLQSQVHSLLEALRLERYRLYGSRSEQSPDQARLFDEVDLPAVDDHDEEHAEAPDAEAVAPSSKGKRQPGRKALPPELPRVERIVELSDEERQCPCGCTLTEIGEEASEQLDIIPARAQVIRTIRKKYACKGCEDTTKTAARPPVLLPKSMASAGTMAFVITSKYADGLPLYRLSGILNRFGIDMPRQTLSESILKVAAQLPPLMSHLNQQLMASPVLYMDETPVQVLNEPGKTPQSRSYMWVQRGGPPDKSVIRFH